MIKLLKKLKELKDLKDQILTITKRTDLAQVVNEKVIWVSLDLVKNQAVSFLNPQVETETYQAS
jgi:dTDP-4-dehydrorhamnose reductase